MKNLFCIVIFFAATLCVAMEEQEISTPEPLKQIVIDYIRKNLAIVEQKSKIKKLPTTLKQELFSDEFETADLAKIIDLVKCSLISIDDLIYNVIFSHMQLATYQKLTLLDLMMMRDDARDNVSNAFLFSCIQQYLKGFDWDWCSHWPSQKMYIEEDKMFLSLLGVAVMRKHLTVLTKLLSMKIKDHPVMDSQDIATAAHVAMANNNKEFFEALYEASVKTSNPLSIGSFLIDAIEGKCKIFIEYLLKHAQGVQVDHYYQPGKTPLSAVVTYSNDTSLLESFLTHQAAIDVNKKDNEGQTALHKVAQKGHLEMMKLLVAFGGNVCAKDNLDFTVLHDAVIGKNEKVIALLLQEGASVMVSAKNTHGETPLQLARDRNMKDVIKLLQPYDVSEKKRWSPSFFKRDKNSKS